jgi:hypothetical protein
MAVDVVRGRAQPRWDVLNALVAAGWKREQGRHNVVTKGDALYATWSSDSGLDGHRGAPTKFTVSFTGDVPDAVIVATCQAAVKGARGRIGSRAAATTSTDRSAADDADR